MIGLVYSHKTNVVIVTLLAFVMIYNTVILVIPAAAFGVCHLRLPLVLMNFGQVGFSRNSDRIRQSTSIRLRRGLLYLVEWDVHPKPGDFHKE